MELSRLERGKPLRQALKVGAVQLVIGRQMC